MTTHDVTNESHREACAECRATWADLERISAEARNLPRLTPSRDLWKGIEARIGGEPAREPAREHAHERARRRWFASPALRMAAAAALLVAVTATITWRVATGGGTTPPLDLADATPGDSLIPNLAPGDAGLSQAELLRTAAYGIDYSRMDGEVRALQVVVEEQYGRLDPKTVELVTRNLALIDTAIAESRKALMDDPGSQYLATELARAYTTKLTLLRNTAKLPAGT
jgi:hypothetical protein